MRYLAIGDVHGCYSALTTLVDLVKPSVDDTIVMMGDYVDRGPDSALVIQWLIDESKSRNLICLKGNHELMMQQARSDLAKRRMWGGVGGDATWDSYSREFDGAGLDAVPQSHWDFIQDCRLYYETDQHVFVHGALYGDVPLADQPEYMLLWETFHAITPLESGKTVICGHTSQKDGIPKNAGHAVCIDTWAYGKGWLTCLDVAAGRYYQANQAGETRVDWLEESSS